MSVTSRAFAYMSAATIAASAGLAGCGGGGGVGGPDQSTINRATLDKAIATGDLTAITQAVQVGINANVPNLADRVQLPMTIGTIDDVMNGPGGVDNGRVRIVGNANAAVIYWSFNLGEKNANDSTKSPSELALAITAGHVNMQNTDSSGIWAQRWNSSASSVHGRAPTTIGLLNTAASAISSYFGIPDTQNMSARVIKANAPLTAFAPK